MFSVLLTFHSIFRWLVLLSLCTTIYRSVKALLTKSPFSKKDDTHRHLTATIIHIQLMLGMVIYFNSPAVARFRMAGMEITRAITDPIFFGVVHIAMMMTAVILVTIGSALAKRHGQDTKKFKTILLFFSIALFIILAAIPWPFSPLA